MKRKSRGFSGGESAAMFNRLYGSRALIEYTMDTVYADDTMERYLYNSGSSRETNNATVYASNAKYMDGVTHSMPVDTVHTLGSDMYSSSNKLGVNTGFTLTSTTAVFDGTDTINGITHQVVSSAPYADGDIIKITLTLSGVTGTPTITRAYSGYENPNTIGRILVNGVNYIEVKMSAGRTQVSISLDQTLGAFGYTYVCNMQLITIPTASYIQYLAYPSLTWKQLSSTVDYGYGTIPVSTTWPLTESFQVALTSTAPLEAADILELNADQDLMFKVWDGTVASLSSGYSTASIVGFLDGTSGIGSSKYVPDIKKEYTATNLLTYSEEFDNAVWTKANSQVTPNTVLAPDNTLTADTIDNSAETLINFGNGIIYRAYTVDCSSKTFSFSMYLKAGTSSTATLFANKSLGEERSFLVFNLTSEWKRFCLPADFLTVSGDGKVYVHVGAGNLQSGVGKGTIYTWGAQFEEGAICTEYTRTVATPTVQGTPISYKTVANFTTDVNINYLNGTTGATNLKLIKDASSRTTGTAAAGTTQWAADGRSANTKWTVTSPFTVTQIADGITYTFTSDGNRYVGGVLSGTYTVPTGEYIMTGNSLFDGVTTCATKSYWNVKNEVIVP